MENSFSKYRNDTMDRLGSDSDEVIDSSIVDQSFNLQRKVPASAKKNQTLYVAESEESASDDLTEDEIDNAKSIVSRSSAAANQIISSSDDDASKNSSSRRQSENFTNVVLTSSSEEGGSPELIPRRRPPLKPRSSNISSSSDSPLIRRVRKRMVLTDSENDNSIIIEKNKNVKQRCLKKTPAKLQKGVVKIEKVPSLVMSDDDDESVGDEKEDSQDDDEGPDEDEMVMCKATRMSIMGVIPKDSGSDDSDFIQSDERFLPANPCEETKLEISKIAGLAVECEREQPMVGKSLSNEAGENITSNSTQRSNLRTSNSIGSTNSLDNLPLHKSINKESLADSADSLQDLPDTGMTIRKSPEKTIEPPDENLEDSIISCSTFGSPVKEDDDTKELTSKEINLTREMDNSEITKENNKESIDLTVLDDSFSKARRSRVNVEDDDVTIIDTKPEIIALSSDDEEQPEPRPARQSTSKSLKQPTLQRFVPQSAPNSGVVYVKKHVRDNELQKLEALRADLKNVTTVMANMEVDKLPDRGSKLKERVTRIQQQVERQAEKVSNMIVEPDFPSAQNIPNDGFDQKGLTWDEIQRANNQVHPRMTGKQAMTTHMAERSLIMDRLKDLHSALESRPPESQLADPPRALRTSLMGHQLHALAWLQWREGQRPAAGILADDMGLGKTITMIALILSDKDRDDDDDDRDDDDEQEWRGKENSNMSKGGTLVVCPASLIQQWAGEVSKHCAAHALSVLLHHGAARSVHAHRLAQHDLVVTTYNLLQRDAEKKGVLMRVRWRRVILDEAHIVRNHKSATSSAVCAVRAARRWCLTGTPVQNKDLDVFALLKFLRLSPFNNLPMWKKWIDNKSAGGQERLSTIMRCLLLRRTKVQLQQKGQLNCLPDRDLHKIDVTLTAEEMNVYQKVLVFSKTLFAQFLHQRAEKHADGSLALGKESDAFDRMHKRMVKLHGAKPVKSHEILVLLLRLRQVCCHCGLIAAMLDGEPDAHEDAGSLDLLSDLKQLTIEDKRKSKNDKEEEEEEQPEEGTTVSEAIRSVLSPNNPVFQLTRLSSKIRATINCLRKHVFVNKGDKAVVVSQWTSVLRLVEQELTKDKIKCVTLSGQVPVPARPPLIAALNDPDNNVRVMLLSLCAGGVGLNLCGANHLLLLDPHWNPQLEEQAQDRIYRVGQKKNVHIYRFMCLETVEQTIRKLQEVKLELAENVLTGAKHNNASKLSIEDLKMLFNMGQ